MAAPKLVRFDLVQEKPIKWFWTGRIPLGVITILEGDPGTGKSQLSCMMAAHTSRGTQWPDGEPCPMGSAIIANAEDACDQVIKPRLRVAGAELAKVFTVTPGDGESMLFSIPENVPWLEHQIADKGVKLVVFDPLEAFISPSVSTKENQHIRRALAYLELMAKRLELAVVIVRHLTKDAAKAAIYRGGGSIGIIGAARSGLSVAKDPTDSSRCIMVPTKSNWGKPKAGLAYKICEHSYTSDLDETIITSAIAWQGEINIDADTLLTRPEGSDAADRASDEVARFLRQELSAGPLPSTLVLSHGTKRGFRRAALFAAAKILGIRIYRESLVDSGEWVWELADPELAEAAGKWANQIEDLFAPPHK